MERLVYIPEVGVLCFSYNSKSFRVYEPKRLTWKHEVHGHRGSVINCCYIGTLELLATCAADMTICLWDCGMFKLRSRIVCKEVRLLEIAAALETEEHSDFKTH